MADPDRNTIAVHRLENGVWRAALGPIEAFAFRPEHALSRLCALAIAARHEFDPTWTPTEWPS